MDSGKTEPAPPTIFQKYFGRSRLYEFEVILFGKFYLTEGFLCINSNSFFLPLSSLFFLKGLHLFLVTEIMHGIKQLNMDIN